MKKQLLILAFLLSTSVFCNAQITFQKIIGGTSNDHGTSVQQTINGGYIIAGDASVIGADYDVYLIKTDDNGDRHQRINSCLRCCAVKLATAA